MKHLIYSCILLFSIQTFAQPGNILELNKNEFERITKELKEDPNNYLLIWKRLNIYYKNFTLYTQGGVKKNQLMLQQDVFIPDWTDEKRISDLNQLIENNAEINDNGYVYNISDFTLMRGQIYYLLGDYENALSDYLFALKNIKSNNSIEYRNKKEKICISLAAYYYNKKDEDNAPYNENKKKENLSEALKYLDMLSLIEYTSDFNDPNLHNDYGFINDPFEHQRINLLKYLNKGERLSNYYINLMRNEFQIYKNKTTPLFEWEIKKSDDNTQFYTTNENYLNALSYAYELANFYYDKENYKKAKQIAEEAIHYFPTNSYGYILDRIPVGNHYLLLNKIYQTKEFKNFDKEMNALIDLLGGSMFGINYDVDAIGNYINQRLQENPNEPRLYLALGIWHYKNNMRSSYPPTASTAEILELFEKAEKLNLKDYRLPFAKAMFYAHLEKNYELSLSEINKSLEAYKLNPYAHTLKYEYLIKLYNQDEKERIEFKTTYDESFKKLNERVYKDMSNLFVKINN